MNTQPEAVIKKQFRLKPVSGCQAFCSSVSVDSISVFIFERGSVSSREFLFLPLASLNLDHFLHTEIGVTALRLALHMQQKHE